MGAENQMLKRAAQMVSEGVIHPDQMIPWVNQAMEERRQNSQMRNHQQTKTANATDLGGMNNGDLGSLFTQSQASIPQHARKLGSVHEPQRGGHSRRGGGSNDRNTEMRRAGRPSAASQWIEDLDLPTG